MGEADSLRQIIAQQQSLLAMMTAARTPGWVFPSVTGLVGIVSGFGAQWFRSWLDDHKTRRMMREMMSDEISSAALWSGAIAAEMSRGREVTAMEVYQIEIRSQLYDRNRDRLGLLPMRTRRGIEAWYQDLKVSLRITEELLAAVQLQGPGGASAQKLRENLERNLRAVTSDAGDLLRRLRDDRRDDVILVGWLLRRLPKRMRKQVQP